MTYTDPDFRTKAALAASLARGEPIQCVEAHGAPAPPDGRVYLLGPRHPARQTWHAIGTCRGGRLISLEGN